MTKERMINKILLQMNIQKQLISYEKELQEKYKAMGMEELGDFAKGCEYARKEWLDFLEELLK